MIALYHLAGLGDEAADLTGKLNDLITQRTTALATIADYENRLRKAISYWGGVASNDPYYYELVSTIEAEKAKVNYIDQQAANVQTQIEQSRAKARADEAAKAEAERRAQAEQARLEAERQAKAEAERRAEADRQAGLKIDGILNPPFPPAGRADPVQPAPIPAPADPILSQPLAPQPSAADYARAERESAESVRRFSFLIGRPGYDYGIGHNERNAFFGVGENMSGLGASFDIVGALTSAAKDASRGIKGSEVLARAGIRLPDAGKVPVPVKTFFESLTRNLKPKAAPAPIAADPLAPSAFVPQRGPDFLTIGLYAAAGFLLYKVVRGRK